MEEHAGMDQDQSHRSVVQELVTSLTCPQESVSERKYIPITELDPLELQEIKYLEVSLQLFYFSFFLSEIACVLIM